MIRPVAVAALLAVLATGHTPPAAAQGDGGTKVSDLLRDGWRVIAKTEAKEHRKGLPPYENLTRVVQVTTYTLGKAGQTMVCRIAYDSQRDHMSEACEAQD